VLRVCRTVCRETKCRRPVVNPIIFEPCWQETLRGRLHALGSLYAGVGVAWAHVHHARLCEAADSSCCIQLLERRCHPCGKDVNSCRRPVSEGADFRRRKSAAFLLLSTSLHYLHSIEFLKISQGSRRRSQELSSGSARTYAPALLASNPPHVPFTSTTTYERGLLHSPNI
jgi:hypothetical protein